MTLDERFRGQEDRQYDLHHRGSTGGDLSARGLSIALFAAVGIFALLIVLLFLR